MGKDVDAMTRPTDTEVEALAARVSELGARRNPLEVRMETVGLEWKRRAEAAEAEVARLQKQIGRWEQKITASADTIRRNYMHQPEKCDDARSFCVGVLNEMRAVLNPEAPND